MKNIENIAKEIQKWVESESCNACEHCSDSIVVGSDALVNFIAELFAKEQKKLECCVVVPVEPTETQWGGLARVLGRYMQNKDRYCPKTLKRHLDMFADEIPEWLNKEVPNWESEHAFATADLPVFIYKAMVEAARGGNEY